MTGHETSDDQALEHIQTLQPGDVGRLRLGWWSRIGASEVRTLLEAAPGLSLWMPASHEHILVGPWRHRADVAHMVDLVAVRHPIELTRAAIEQAQSAGVRLFIAVEMVERRQVSFYERLGMTPLETVISYEAPTHAGTFSGPPGPEMERVDELTTQSLEELVAVDWDAFPWLWRNSEEEFREYFTQPGVELFVLRERGESIGYLGLTVFPGWGHIDRLAVVRAEQGRGWGRALTEFAIAHLASLGAVRVALSTQQRNGRSQALYSRLGFKRQVAGDYRIYGRALWQNDAIDDLVMGT
jgi:ribosomal protein S18 acetylase RimI-like enzyme